MDSARAFLKGVQAVLKANATISSICGTRVYGAPKANPTYPFMVISCESSPFAAKDFSGMEHKLRVQSFARENKPATVLELREAAMAALNRNEAGITVQEASLVEIEFSGVAMAFPEPDGRTYQSVIEFIATVQ